MKRTFQVLGVAVVMSTPLGAQQPADQPARQANVTDRDRPAIVVSTQVNTWPQGGYHVELSLSPPHGRLEVGGSVSGGDLRGIAKDLVFDIDGNEDDVDLRLRWVVGVGVRYRLTGSRNGAWVGVSGGVEEFRARATSAASGGFRDRNGFISLRLGYRWHPLARRGLFLQPQLAVNALLFRPEIREIVGVSYRLRSVHPAPSLAFGWRF